MVKPRQKNLIDFQSLASKNNLQSRNDLARHVATLFSFTSDNCSDEQMENYDAVLLRLVDMIEVEARAFVAMRLAKLRRAPEKVIRLLANDEPDVARPVLVHSPVLHDDDLVEIVKTREEEHRLAIASRETLTVVVTDALIDNGEAQVKKTVAENEGASFSPQGFAKLIDMAHQDENLQYALSTRCDLAEKQIMQLISIASDKVKAKLIEEDDPTSVGRLPQAARIAAQRMSNDYWIGRYDFEDAHNNVLAIARNIGLDETTLRRFAAEDKFPEAVSTFSLLAGIGMEEAKLWMVRLDMEPFLIVARANNFSPMTVQAILKIGPWRYRLSAKNRADALARYSDIKFQTARTMLIQWQKKLVG